MWCIIWFSYIEPFMHQRNKCYLVVLVQSFKALVKWFPGLFSGTGQVVSRIVWGIYVQYSRALPVDLFVSLVFVILSFLLLLLQLAGFSVCLSGLCIAAMLGSWNRMEVIFLIQVWKLGNRCQFFSCCLIEFTSKAIRSWAFHYWEAFAHPTTPLHSYKSGEAVSSQPRLRRLCGPTGVYSLPLALRFVAALFSSLSYNPSYFWQISYTICHVYASYVNKFHLFPNQAEISSVLLMLSFWFYWFLWAF